MPVYKKYHDFHHSALTWLSTIEEVITAIKQDTVLYYA